jgi:hypothetical protein
MNQKIRSSLDIISQIDSLLTRNLSDDVRQLITEVREDVVADTLTIKPLRESYIQIEEEWKKKEPFFPPDYTEEIFRDDFQRFINIVKLVYQTEARCCCIDKPSQYAQHFLRELVVRKTFIKGSPKFQNIGKYINVLNDWHEDSKISQDEKMKHDFTKPYIKYLITQLEEVNNS